MTNLNNPGYRLTSVGIKILGGVGLVSSLFIGALLYVHVRASDSMAVKVNEVLAIKENLSVNLRQAIVNLQDEFLSLPDFFKTDPRAMLEKAVEEAFQVSDRQMLRGRDAYSHLFDRTERRDLANSGFVIQTEKDALRISFGVFDENNTFQDAVACMTLASTNPPEDAIRLRSLLAQVTAEAASGTVLRQKVSDLSARVADSGLAAEATRNEILQHVEGIRAMEQELLALRDQQRHSSRLMGGLAILANIVVLFFLIRMVVERPLHMLTSTIGALNTGNSRKFPLPGGGTRSEFLPRQSTISARPCCAYKAKACAKKKKGA